MGLILAVKTVFTRCTGSSAFTLSFLRRACRLLPSFPRKACRLLPSFPRKACRLLPLFPRKACRLLPSFPRRRESTAAHHQRHGFPPARE
ncbi:MAG: hypothetical protein KA079_00490 [Brachymonas sp.]|nr:hypothetical protein [Brachymonas sp.]